MATPALTIDVARLDRIAKLITELKGALSVPSVAGKELKEWPMPSVQALQMYLVADWLKDFMHFIDDNTVWISMATDQKIQGAQLTKMITDAKRWKPLENIAPTTTNIVANEEYLIYEHGATATHSGSMQFKNQLTRATGKKIEWLVADVIKFNKKGKIDTIQHYSDSVGLTIQLGLMQNVSAGHDEAPVSPHLDNGTNISMSGEMMAARKHGAFFGGISVGNGRSKKALSNIENCKGIHEAFVSNNSAAFSKLIAEDSVWIDAPTRTILRGALAAAHHDHSNWSRAFTNNSATVHNIIANEQWSIVQHRGNGTHLGELQLGGTVFAPTGKKVSINVLDCVKINEEGKASLIRNYYDVGSMMFQLGVVNKFLI